MCTKQADEALVGRYHTSWGDGRVAIKGGRLVGVGLPSLQEPEGKSGESRQPVDLGERAALDRWVKQLEAYFRGERLGWTADDVLLDELPVSSFDRAVYKTLLSVPPAVTVSYGTLAEMAGFPRAARAVGNAMANNPIPIVVPCHRVIRADGSLGNYGDDPSWKERLLEHEREHASRSGGDTCVRPDACDEDGLPPKAVDRKFHLTVITGLSGAGKSEAVATFEDVGYFCIDNLPPQMLPGVVQLFGLEGSRVNQVALVFDARGRSHFEELGRALDYLRESGIDFRVLYLEASNEALVARYQATRRPHPLSPNLVEGIARERRLLARLRSQADVIVDTTSLSPKELRRQLEETLLADRLSDQLFVSLESFGYRYGLPDEADMVLDTRFLPNPHWVVDLRPQSGLDAPVRDYVVSRPETEEFLGQVVALVRFLAPRFLAEQKRRVVLAVGCTGGRHRSVALAEELAGRLRAEPALMVGVRHRDVDRTE
jgi:RNase adapter protein RapZ